MLVSFIVIASILAIPLLFILRADGDAAGGAGSTTTAPPPSTPAPAAAPPAPSTPAPSTTTQAPPAAAGWREQAQQHFGSTFNFSQYQDDNSAMRAMAEQLRNAQAMRQFADLGQQVLPHYGQFQNWLQQQQADEAAKRASASKWWDAPEYDASWMNNVVQDEQGNWIAKPGADPMLPQKIAAARHFQTQKMFQFLQNPIETIRPGLEPLINDLAMKIVQQHLGQFSAQATATDYMRQNSGWIHAHDKDNRIIMDPATQRPALSEAGVIFKNHLIALQQAGMPDGPVMYDYAKRLCLADLQAMAAQQTVPGATPPANPPGTPPANPPGTNRLQGLDTTAAATGAATKAKGKPLRAQMNDALKAAGITEIASRW
jgi:hypothetical protein